VFERCIYSKIEENIPDIITELYTIFYHMKYPLDYLNFPSTILFKLFVFVKLNFWRGARGPDSGPKPGAVDKGCLEIFSVNLDPLNDAYIA